MTLSDEQIKKYQELYKKHYGKEISRKDTLAYGLQLVQLMKFVYLARGKRSSTKTA